jgi:two-component system, NtrC family, response regulator AtoC
MSLTVLIVDDEENARSFIGTYLKSKNYDVQEAATLGEARNSLRKGIGDVILLDVQLPDGYGLDLLEEMALMPMRPPIIVITAYGDIEMAVSAMKNGAHDFLQKPIDFGRLEQSIQRAQKIVSIQRELYHTRNVQKEQVDFVIGKSKGMINLIDAANRAAETNSSILITGQTGTGKEVLARYIHKIGPRSGKTLMDINCAAIQSTVLESELFGYEAGAFTGADKRKLGLMEFADGGILLLDEISSMPVDIQAKLLRAIEQQSFRRVGGSNLIKVDVQILAISNRDLPNMIREGSFRSDLYYRLNVLDLQLPPLCARKEDIPELVGLFLRKMVPLSGKNISGITPKAVEALMNHDWPGNIRELKNVIDRAIIFCDEECIDIAHLPADLVRH